MGIPLADGNERVDLWHPVFYARVEALCADERMRGKLEVQSAVRTYDEQVALYQGWLAELPGFNLAANPDQWLTPAYGLASARGSWHMAQPDGHGYAVDFQTGGLPADVYAALPVVAAEYRLVQTVLFDGQRPPDSGAAPEPATPTPPHLVKEWWHFQPPYNEGALTWVPEEDDMPLTEADHRAIAAEVVKQMEPKVKATVAAELREMLGEGSRTREILLRTEEKAGEGAKAVDVVRQVEPKVKETVSVELREMLGEGSRTREILEHADASAAEAAEAARSAVGAVADVIERIPRLIPVGGLVARFDDIKDKLDRILDNTDDR